MSSRHPQNMAELMLVLSLMLLTTCTFAAPAKRIVALSPHAVEMLYAIGAGDKILAAVDYSDYPEAARSIPRVGNFNGIQIEQVLMLQPDLVVAWRSGNKVADLKKLESLGLPVIYTQPNTIAQIADELRKLGELTGNQDQAEQAAIQLESRYRAIRQRFQSKAGVTVFYQLWHDPLRTVGAGSWINSLVTDCGGENIFADTPSDYPLVSMETVIARKPQVIIIPHHSGNVGAKDEIWQNWPQIPAVAARQIHLLNGDLLHRFGPRAVDGLLSLCEAIDNAR